VKAIVDPTVVPRKVRRLQPELELSEFCEFRILSACHGAGTPGGLDHDAQTQRAATRSEESGIGQN
jgi:hypothetical protein